MGDYHPAVRLRHGPVQIDGNYDGTISLSPTAEPIGRDGNGLGHRLGHTYVIDATHPDYDALIRVLAEAHRDHYRVLDLDPPAEAHLPFYLRTHSPAHQSAGAEDTADTADTAMAEAAS